MFQQTLADYICRVKECSSVFIYWEDGGSMVLQNVGVCMLNGITSQMTMVSVLYAFSRYIFMLNYNANACLEQGLLFNSNRARSYNDVRVALFYVRNDGVWMYICLYVWLVFYVAYDTDDDRPIVIVSIICGACFEHWVIPEVHST
jgi:hypothetical protein